VIAEETGVASVVDPLGGSWYLEELTDRLEQEAEEIFAEILDLGGRASQHPIGPVTSGILAGIDQGWFIRRIADSAAAYQDALERGDKQVVGVTVHTEDEAGAPPILRIGPEVEERQTRALQQRRSGRDAAAVQQALDALRRAAQGEESLVEPLLAAARVEATLGEMCECLGDVFGSFVEPAQL
jgi:methylmalonyl-CoA mutase N-terminal domain/subunit